MFSPMRAILAGTRYLVNLEILDAGGDPPDLPLTALDVLAMATREGARVAWLGDEVGTLTPGRKADVILVRTDDLAMRPLNYPAGAVIESGHPGLVETVFVDGVPVKRDGALVAHDVAAVIRRADAARDGLLSRAGVEDPGRWQPPAYTGG